MLLLFLSLFVPTKQLCSKAKYSMSFSYFHSCGSFICNCCSFLHLLTQLVAEPKWNNDTASWTFITSEQTNCVSMAELRKNLLKQIAAHPNHNNINHETKEIMFPWATVVEEAHTNYSAWKNIVRLPTIADKDSNFDHIKNIKHQLFQNHSNFKTQTSKLNTSTPFIIVDKWRHKCDGRRWRKSSIKSSPKILMPLHFIFW